MTKNSKIRSTETDTTYQFGDRVRWTHGPTGKRFRGTIVARVPAGYVIGGQRASDVRSNLMALARGTSRVPADMKEQFREAASGKLDQIGTAAPRDDVSYMVMSDTDNRLLWPPVSSLSRVPQRRTADSQSN